MQYPEEVNNLRVKLSARHHAGEHRKCAFLGEKLIQLHKKNRNTRSMSYADDLFNLAMVYEDMGMYEKAVNAYADSMRVVELLAGKGAEYAYRLTNMAIVYGKSGNHQSALALHRQAEIILVRVFGPRHPAAMDALHNVAGCLFDAGMHQRALNMHKKSLELRKEAGDPLAIADSLNACGYCCEALGNGDGARSCFIEALGVLKGLEGGLHEDYISSLSYYGEYMYNTERFTEARVAFDTAAKLLKKRYSDQHLYYAGALGRLADAHEKEGNIKTSLNMKQKAVTIMIKSIGGNHLYFAGIYKNMALRYHSLGDDPSAIRNINKSLKIKEALIGRNNESYARDTLLLILFYLESSNYKKMSATLEGALKHINVNDPEAPSYYKGMKELYFLTKEMAKLQEGITGGDYNGSLLSLDLKKAEALTELFKHISDTMSQEQRNC